MEKHYELKEDKFMFLIELWCREHNVTHKRTIELSPEEAARYEDGTHT